jgi:hypothetical protein
VKAARNEQKQEAGVFTRMPSSRSIECTAVFLVTACLAMLPSCGASSGRLPSTLKFTPAANSMSDTDDFLLSMVTAGEEGAVEIPRMLTRPLKLSVRIPQALSLRAADVIYRIPREVQIGAPAEGEGQGKEGSDQDQKSQTIAEAEKPKQTITEFLQEMEEQRYRRPVVQDDGSVSILDMQLRKSDIVRVSELELRHRGGAFEVEDFLKAGGDKKDVKNAELGGCCCIGVDGGSMILSMCTISASNGSCVGVTGTFFPTCNCLVRVFFIWHILWPSSNSCCIRAAKVAMISAGSCISWHRASM